MNWKTALPGRILARPAILAILVLFVAAACSSGSSKPTILISSPPHGAQFREGESVAIQSIAKDAVSVARIDLVVDGTLVRSDASPVTQNTLTLSQMWTAVAGSHTISVRAYNAAGTASDPAAIAISVAAAAPAAVPSATLPASPAIATILPTLPPPALASPTNVPPTPVPTAVECTNAAAYVADVSIPDGTVVAPGQTMNKTWRVRNSGTCAWGPGYQFVFAGGEQMAAVNSIAVPATAAGATADLTVPMTAPATPGIHIGKWRMRSAAGSLFGGTLTVNVNVVNPNAPSPVPQAPQVPQATGCTGTPTIGAFSAAPTGITAGNSSTLSWDTVTGADAVEIDHEIGGVATPGNTSVSPGETTTYTLTARCGGNTAQKQVTVSVTTLAPPVVAFPDLYVSEFSLSPNPPSHSASVHVRVGVYNKGTAAVSKSFTVEWWPGSNYPSAACSWTISSLAAKGGRILECDKGSGTWASGYANITTRVKVDPGNAILESDKSNNVYDVKIKVN